MSFDMSPASPDRAQAVAGVSLYTDELGRAVCARVAAGESLRRIGAEAGWPSPATVWKWAQREAGFAEALSAAQRAARVAARLRDRAAEAVRPGRLQPWRRGAPELYCEGLAEEICRRLVEGETLQAICRDPDMPCWSTIYQWLRKHPEFEEMYVTARMAAGDWLADEALEAGRAATPATVWADRLRHDVARRAAAQREPRKYEGRLVALRELIRLRDEEAEAKAARPKPSRAIIVFHFERSPDGTEVLRIPPNGPEDEAKYEKHYGKPYDGPRFQLVAPD